ncbi:FkbM family methyltransferase [Spirulina sp. 06S082]|uniref:FkbM family methyltransferase n=1 Tax=Spirulina sp. 06S082 TaxID=3110248 RepID=UPI002B1F295D|nr:FkbM family methyltransferase [Spirulina sp. 06S082]MEA5468253.1 FkbM family methyltransferase [Spirulina sp. 06S082]
MEKLKLPNGLECYCLSQKETEYIFSEIFSERQYLQNNIVVRPGDCIFDVGANIGLFALFMSQIQENLKIFSFEPIETTFAVLKENIRLHDLSNVSPFKYGLGSENDRERVFTFYPNMPGNSTAKPEEKIIQKNLMVDVFGQEQTDYFFQKIQVIGEVKKLSRVIKDLSINSIDLLKIDVEGDELDVIQGIETDDWKKVKQVVAEIHNTDNKLEEFCSILESNGFAVTIEKNALMPSTLNNCNIYAMRH